MPALQVALHPLIQRMPVSLIGVLVALCMSTVYQLGHADLHSSAHQMALSLLGWQNYVLHAPRTNLISANKEGLVSLSGTRPFFLILGGSEMHVVLNNHRLSGHSPSRSLGGDPSSPAFAVVFS
jgi:hypothetical protein